MEQEKREFVTLDWVLFAGMLVISAGIGIFYACYGGRQKTTGEFLMGNRNMQLIPVAISILVSFMSAILILGTPAEMYNEGTQYYLYLIGMILAVSLAALLFVPLLYPLKLTSSFEVCNNFNCLGISYREWFNLLGKLRKHFFSHLILIFLVGGGIPFKWSSYSEILHLPLIACIS